MHTRLLLALSLVVLSSTPMATRAQNTPPAAIVQPDLGSVMVTGTGARLDIPDPAAVQRYGPAYRYPQAGWIVLHIEGQPYERGYQHGRLLAPEIADFLKASANMANPQTPAEGWQSHRTLVNALFLRQYEPEYVEEMKGIADGANAVGVRWENRPLDVLDIVAMNAWAELMTLDSALDALPTGLEGKTFPNQEPRAMPAPKGEHCSAFAATGPATKDGKIVFGHITMFGLYSAHHFNVWLDVKPAKGHRVLMQSYPGGIQSGMDYYLNDVGLMVTETTIGQTRFNIKGQALASRIRQALQYGSSIDDVVAILSKDNNGLYTNEWLIGDTKTNEIAMFELGTHKTKLYRSSKNEWFDGTPGFYWGCNNTKDREVRLETFASVDDRPANVVYRPSDRDQKWVELYEQHKGKIDVSFGKLAFTTSPLAAHSSLDAKVTTTDMANKLETWALFGPPLGRSWQPRLEERKRYPDIKPLISNPWTILQPAAPVSSSGAVADLPMLEKGTYKSLAELNPETPGFSETIPAWRGTLFPATPGDIWLATAFAEYEHIVAAELARLTAYKKAGSTPSALKEAEFVAGRLYGYRTAYLSAAAIDGPTPLASIQTKPGDSRWYRQAVGKGVLCMHALREFLGLPVFIETMNKFGTANGGKEVTTAAFIAHCEHETGKPVGEFLKPWLEGKELPALTLDKIEQAFEAGVTSGAKSAISVLTGEVNQTNGHASLTVRVFAETDQGMTGTVVNLKDGKGTFELHPVGIAKRVFIVPSDASFCEAGGKFAINSFMEELPKTLIVYGTGDEKANNLETAQNLQEGIVVRGSNFTIPYKSDIEATEADVKNSHLILIGRPESNLILAGLMLKSGGNGVPLDSNAQDALRPRSIDLGLSKLIPVVFGPRSFTVQGVKYANAGSAVIAAGANPLNPRYSVVVVAGMGAEATFQAVPSLLSRGSSTEVLLLPARAGSQNIVVTPSLYTKELTPATKVTRAAAAGGK